MNKKTNGYIGITAIALGTLSIIIMAALRTDGYNHLNKAVSELGSTDAPNNWVFNLLGFIIPGILISIFSYNLLKEFRRFSIKSYPFYLLILSGLFIVMAGIFPANIEDRKSVTTTMHLIGAQGSGIFWLLSALTLCWQLKKNKLWKGTAIASFIIPFLMLLAMVFVSKDTPGLAQRIVFIAMYLFILILAVKQLLVANYTTQKSI